MTRRARTISSLTGLPKDGDSIYKSYRPLNAFLSGQAVSGPCAVTNVRLQAAWVYTPVGGVKVFHRQVKAALAWVDDQRPRPMVQTACGWRSTWFTTSMNPPEHPDLCDDCVLVDLRVPYVYRFFDENERLLYVGYSIDPVQRFKQHSKAKSSRRWWPLQRRVTLMRFDTEAEGLAAENAAILTEKPIYNRRNVPMSEWVTA